uniref:Uncharacterized protein n=1 Tax=Xiphophorus couchianus TaxID=32473 RepID=A0A3B5LA19_9TELE
PPPLSEMKEKNPWHKPLTIIITVIGVIAIVALVTVAGLQNRPVFQKYKYGIVLDAGSSHTALYIYKWPAEKDNNTGRIEQKHSCKVKVWVHFPQTQYNTLSCRTKYLGTSFGNTILSLFSKHKLKVITLICICLRGSAYKNALLGGGCIRIPISGGGGGGVFKIKAFTITMWDI